METFIRFMRHVSDEESGQDMVEYALLIGLISVVAVAALITAGTAINALWKAVTDALGTATAAI